MGITLMKPTALLPLRFQAVPGIFSMSVRTVAVFPLGGNVTERTTVETGLMRPSVQEESLLTLWPLGPRHVPPTAFTVALELVSSTPGCVTAMLTVLMAAMSLDVQQLIQQWHQHPPSPLRLLHLQAVALVASSFVVVLHTASQTGSAATVRSTARMGQMKPTAPLVGLYSV